MAMSFMLQMIRSVAILPSRYSWMSTPSNSMCLPVAGMPGGRWALVRGGGLPPVGGAGAVTGDVGAGDQLEGQVGECAPGVVEEFAYVALPRMIVGQAESW